MPKRSGHLSLEQLRALARTGAETALKQLRAEIIAIERAFPEFALPGPAAQCAAQLRKPASAVVRCRPRLGLLSRAA